MNNEKFTLKSMVTCIFPITTAISAILLANEIYKCLKPRKFYKNNMNVKKACKILGITVTQYKKMSKGELKQVYRMKVKQTHPDINGAQSSKAFRDVKEAYEFAAAA